MSSTGDMLPPTYVPGWHREDDVRRVQYQRVGQTDMIVSKLIIGGGQFSAGVKIDDHEQVIGGIDEVRATIIEGLKSGLNYIDTAPLYGAGDSEIVLGEIIKDIPRKAFYLATKLGRRHDCAFDFSREKILGQFNRSLAKLQVDHIDVIQVHDIEFADDLEQIVTETLPALDELRRSGKVSYIGITGYPLSTLKELAERSKVKLDLVLSYSRQTLFESELTKYSEFFRGQGMGIINAAVHGMGLLTPFELPVWHAATDDIRAACKQAVQLAQSKNLEIGRLTLGHALRCSHADAILVGMNNRKVLDMNLDVLRNGLTEKEVEVLGEIERNIMSKLSRRNWEWIEVGRYREDKKAFQNFWLSVNNKPPVK